MVDGLAAARWLLNLPNVDPGYCLRYVWQAYKAQGASTGRSAPTATDGWWASDGKHPGDRNPPPGAAVWWGRRYDGNNDGDVTISLGGGWVAATDYPGWRQTGSVSLAGREQQIGREYLGWTECIFDVPVTQASTPAAPAAPTSEEDDMPKLIEIDAGSRGKHVAAIGDKLFRHYVAGDPMIANQNVFMGGKPPVPVLVDELPSLLVTAGCDRNIWDIVRDAQGRWQFVVLDPLTGKIASGQVWTAENAIRAALGKA